MVTARAAVPGAANKLPKVLNFRTSAATSGELLATVAFIRALADKAGWPVQQAWRRAVLVQHAAIVPGKESTADQRVLAWRRALMMLASAARRIDGDGEETYGFHLGTVTSTLEPGGALRPADLTTSGWPSDGAARDASTAKWRAASWPLWVMSPALWNIYVSLPSPYCIAYNMCGLKPEPGTSPEKLATRAPLHVSVEGVDAAGPWRSPASDPGVTIVAMTERCEDGQRAPRDCFALGEKVLRPRRMAEGKAETAPGRTRLVRALIIDERDSASQGAEPLPGVVRLRLAVPAGVTSVRMRSGAMPPPMALFDEVELTATVEVEVVGGVADIEAPTTRPGAVIVEVAL